MRIIALLVASGLLMAGCGSPEPKEPEHTPTTAATLTVPTMPPEARADSEAGAIAFVKHYIEVFNYASNTGDVKELQKLSDPKCEGCTKYIELYKKTYAAGGYFKGSDWALSELSAETQQKRLLVFATMSSAQGTYRKAKGSKEEKAEPDNARLVFAPDRTLGGWSIDIFERQKGY